MNMILQTVHGVSYTYDSTVLQEQLPLRSIVALLLGHRNNANITYH
jgi:hypothetical protein